VDCLKNSRDASETGLNLRNRRHFADDGAFRTSPLGRPMTAYPHGTKFFQKDKKQQYKNI
jgi:hypothetical protein